ncbi:hypothetical protein SAMN04489724_4542 [Algoriphagus locisalis]|uniref:Uncharacterized protein n=1 Tax=Algoriphagus locisalis TaxID=305507 RepID=A0A1I7DXE8_9BACT|nr:hypothetical protein SAMN04489724_4542 [Algoriphagus locisalis]
MPKDATIQTMAWTLSYLVKRYLHQARKAFTNRTHLENLHLCR